MGTLCTVLAPSRQQNRRNMGQVHTYLACGSSTDATWGRCIPGEELHDEGTRGDDVGVVEDPRHSERYDSRKSYDEAPRVLPSAAARQRSRCSVAGSLTHHRASGHAVAELARYAHPSEILVAIAVLPLKNM